MRKRIHRGFTLVELMIIVAIIAILVAFTVPAYQDFTVRTRVAELVMAAGNYKTSVVTKAQEDGGDLTQSGLTLTVVTGGKVSGGNITDGGIITVSGNASTVGTTIDIVMTPSMQGQRIIWTCSSAASTWKFVPPECRH